MIHKVDQVVGKNLRNRRIHCGKSQEELGKAVGVSFQQIQKYERGINRISASRLWEFSRQLNTPIDSFFVGLEIRPSDKTQQQGDSEINRLLSLYYAIPNEDTRKQLVTLMRTLMNA